MIMDKKLQDALSIVAVGFIIASIIKSIKKDTWFPPHR